MKVAIAETLRWKMLRGKKEQPGGQAEVRVWYRCPYCKKRHMTREIRVVYYNSLMTTPCGSNRPVRVRMPWAKEDALADY